MKPADVPTYVEYGRRTWGSSGRILSLRRKAPVRGAGPRFAACKMVVAGPAELAGKLDSLNNKGGDQVSPYREEYFEHKRRESIEVIKLNGSVELAPLVGLAEVIVDLVETGRTLKENGLVVLEP